MAQKLRPRRSVSRSKPRIKLERLVLRAVHPAGSRFTAVLGPPPGNPVWVPKRRHHDLPLC